MPPTPHVERHFTASETVRDIVIGMSDGLTVPFALAAALSGATLLPRVIVTAGFAEIAAGSIAMGLGGYLAAKNDAEHFFIERAREEREIKTMPAAERAEVAEVFVAYGLTAAEAAPLVQALSERPKAWVDFMMRFELGLEAPDPKRALQSSLTIAGSYVGGGLIPLLPYLLLPTARAALWASVALTLTALLVFGFIKARFTGAAAVRSALQTAATGGLAASAAFLIARLVS